MQQIHFEIRVYFLLTKLGTYIKSLNPISWKLIYLYKWKTEETIAGEERERPRKDLTKMSTISFYLLTYVTVKDLLTSIPIQLPPVQHCSSLEANFYHSLSLKLMLFTEAFNSTQVLTLI